MVMFSMNNIKANTILQKQEFLLQHNFYTGSALANLGSLNVTDRLISPIKLEYKQTFLQEALRNSRFNTTMKVVLGK
jgi:hypothetical protein